MLTHEQAAQQMGMALREIVAVAELGDGHVVTTHDGVHTLLRPGCKPVRYTGPLAVTPVEPVDEGQADGVPVDEGQAGGDQAATTPAGDQADAVPDGAAHEVIAWTNGDPDRAARALAVEVAKEKPRVSLVAALEKAVNQ